MYAIVREKLKEHKKTISPQAFTELRNKTGNDMGQIFDELNKIITFVGEKQQIEKSDVEDLVTKSDFEGIFDLTRAVSQRSLPLALATLKSIMKSTRKNDKEDNPPIKIHFMLTRQIRLLLQAKLLMENGHLKPLSSLSNYDSFQQQVFNKLSPQLINLLPESKQSNLLKQSPYPMYITIQQAKNFTVEELIKAMGRLLEADVQLKSGTLTPELVVEILVVDLCSPSKK
jgi:DNA polymerase-3 subunit delta